MTPVTNARPSCYPIAMPLGLATILAGMMLTGFSPGTSAAEVHEGRVSVAVTSPDDTIAITFELKNVRGESAAATYRVSYDGKPLVEESRLGLDFAESGPFGSGLQIKNVAERTHDETYHLVIGKSNTARDHFEEAVILLEEQAAPQRQIELIMRAYNDGVAFRYRIPEQSAIGEFQITDEHSQFAFPGDSLAYAKPLSDYTTPYEGFYDVVPLKELKQDQLFGVPLLVKHPRNVWIAITEANLTDYAGMFPVRLPDSETSPKMGTSVLETRLAPQLDHPEVKVYGRTPHPSPWRVLMIADDPARLIESGLIVNLNEPCAIADTSWIKPGKVLFPWWNGYVVEGEDFEGGLNTATMKHYIDFCAESGIESFSLDGFRDRAWYGGKIQPADGDKIEDLTTSIPEIDLPEILRYAKEQGVLLRIWMHWKPLKPQIDKAFAKYEEWGIAGVMVDFLDRNDQEMVAFYREIAEKAAKHHLTVNYHGAYKPTGLRRTYPNLLTREGVMNLEYNKFNNSRGSTPEHELLVPFTRMLAGPLDFHQGGFRHVVESEFHPQWIAPLVMGTRARTLATYVVFENHLPMVCDYPAAYRGQTGIEFVASVPASWDETRVLNAEVGDDITIARRNGDDWYIGSMTDSTARKLTIPLSFLPQGNFLATIYRDDTSALDEPAKVIKEEQTVTAADTSALDEPAKVIKEEQTVTAADTIIADMSPAGGHVVHLMPAPKDGKPSR